MAIDLTDKTSNGNNLTNVNATEVTASLPFAASKIAVDTETTNSAYLYAADSVSLSLNATFTLAGWFKFESFPSDQNTVMLAKWDSAAVNDRSYNFNLVDAGGNKTLRLLTSNDGSNITGNVSVAWTPSLDTWYHIAVTKNTTTVKFYVDGSQLGTDQTLANGDISDEPSPFQIGANDGITSPFNFHDGSIDDVRVYSSVISDFSNRSQNLTGSEAGLVAYWPFEVLAAGASGLQGKYWG